MKTYRNIVLALSLVAVVSCDLLGGDEPKGKGTIGFSRLSIASVNTKSSEKNVSESCSDGLFGASFNVISSESSIENDVLTKATEVTVDNLGDFYVDGFLDKEIQQMDGASKADKDNLHFINKEIAAKSGNGKWAFVNDQNWRNGVHHYFWGFNKDIDLSVTGEKNSTASFDYASNSQDDLLLSYTPRYYGNTDEDESKRVNSLKLVFNHALSAIRADISRVGFKIKDESGTGTHEPQGEEVGRGEVTDVSFRLVDKGSCQVTGSSESGDLTFDWSKSSMGEVVGVEDNADRFVIPQNSKEVVTVFTVKDNKRNVEKFYTAPNLLGLAKTESGVESNMWTAGKRYFYDITGNFVLPYLSESAVDGIDGNFRKKGLQNMIIVNDLDARFVSKVRVVFKGLPEAGDSDKGTFAYISIEPKNADGTPRFRDHFYPDVITDSSVEAEYANANNTANLKNPRIGFIYDMKADAILRGELVKGTTDTYTCDIDVPQDWENGFDLYAFFRGGANADGHWHINSISMTILQWR